MSDEAKIESLVRVAGGLIALLEREANLLAEMKTGDIANLQEEKSRLVELYEEQVRSLAQTPELIERIAPALRDEFAEIAEKFDQAMTKNRRALTAAKEAQETFLNAVIRAAEDKRSTLQTYSAIGSVPSGAERGDAIGPLSLTLDRQL